MLNFIFYQINRIFTSVCVHYCQFLMSMSKRVVKCILRARKLRVAPLCVLSYCSAFSHWENVQCAVWALRPVAGTVTVTTAQYDNNWTDRTVSLRTIETNECLRKITLKCTASVNCQTVIIKPDAHFFSGSNNNTILSRFFTLLNRPKHALEAHLNNWPRPISEWVFT